VLRALCKTNATVQDETFIVDVDDMQNHGEIQHLTAFEVHSN